MSGLLVVRAVVLLVSFQFVGAILIPLISPIQPDCCGPGLSLGTPAWSAWVHPSDFTYLIKREC